MAKLGLGAYVETSGAEVRPLETRRWRRATIGLLTVLLFQLQLLAIVLAWDTSQLDAQGLLQIVPEPATATLLAGAVFALGCCLRRRRNKLAR